MPAPALFKALSALALLAAAPVTTQGPAQDVDALTAAPDNFRLILENDQVRVLEYRAYPSP